MIKSESIAELAKALCKAQGEFPVIPKDCEVEVKNREGKFLYTYKYADLSTIITHTRPVMSKYGLSFTQSFNEGSFCTMITHESGQQIVTGIIPVALPKYDDMKQMVAAVTYAKRISLTAALGISPEDDVDAAASETDNTTKRTEISTQKPIPNLAPKQNAPPALAPNPVIPRGEAPIIATEKAPQASWTAAVNQKVAENQAMDPHCPFENYKITFSKKWKGKILGELSHDQIYEFDGFVKWWKETKEKEGKPLTKYDKDFLHHAEGFLAKKFVKGNPRDSKDPMASEKDINAELSAASNDFMQEEIPF